MFATACFVCTRYGIAEMGKQVRSTGLYHFRQWGILLKPRSDRSDYIIVCFVTHDCSRKYENTVPVRLSVV